MFNDQRSVQEIFRGMRLTSVTHLCVAVILTTMGLVLLHSWQQVFFWIPAGVFYVTAVLIRFFGERLPFNISSTIVNLSVNYIVIFLAIVGTGLAVIVRSNDLGRRAGHRILIPVPALLHVQSFSIGLIAHQLHEGIGFFLPRPVTLRKREPVQLYCSIRCRRPRSAEVPAR